MILLTILLTTTYSTSIDSILKQASIEFAQGEYHKSLDNYDQAIKLDPSRPASYLMRTSVYMTLGKNDLAIKDFTKVIELRPSALNARFDRGKLRLQQGDLSEAIQDFKVYFASENDEHGLMQQAEEAFNAFSHLQNNNNCDMENLNILLRICPRFLEMLQRRAECLLKNDNIPEAINDYARYLRLQPNNQLHLKLATLYIMLGELDNSLGSVKECLRSDPDHKDCKKHFKTIKKLQKDFSTLQESISKRKWTEATRMLFDEGLVQQVEAYNANNLNKIVYLAACQAYARMRQHDNCIKYCSKVLEIDSENLEARINRAQSHLTIQNFDQAKSDFAKAHELDRSNQKVIDGYQKAELGLKRQNMKDHYKILGVPRTATQKEIKKQYRKQAQIYHPDKYRGDLTPDQVQTKMAEINQAYEILSNEELRQRYDNGDDASDHNQQQSNPFGGGFPADFFSGFGGFNGHHGFEFKFQGF